MGGRLCSPKGHPEGRAHRGCCHPVAESGICPAPLLPRPRPPSPPGSQSIGPFWAAGRPVSLRAGPDVLWSWEPGSPLGASPPPASTQHPRLRQCGRGGGLSPAGFLHTNHHPGGGLRPLCTCVLATWPMRVSACVKVPLHMCKKNRASWTSGQVVQRKGKMSARGHPAGRFRLRAGGKPERAHGGQVLGSGVGRPIWG